MGAFSDYLEAKVLEHTLRNVGYTSPATVYVALYTSNPGETNTGTEVSGGSYARTAATFGAASGGAISNSADIIFPQASGSWGTVTHFAIFDASTSGNMLIYGALTSSQTVASGQRFRIDATNLPITLD